MINRLGAKSAGGNGTQSKKFRIESASQATTARRWLQRLQAEFNEHPRTALTAAVSLGVLVGWLIKRR